MNKKTFFAAITLSIALGIMGPYVYGHTSINLEASTTTEWPAPTDRDAILRFVRNYNAQLPTPSASDIGYVEGYSLSGTVLTFTTVYAQSVFSGFGSYTDAGLKQTMLASLQGEMGLEQVRDDLCSLGYSLTYVLKCKETGEKRRITYTTQDLKALTFLEMNEEEMIEKSLVQAAQGITSSCPIVIDDATQLVRCMYSYHLFTYYYKATTNAYYDICVENISDLMSAMKEVIKGNESSTLLAQLCASIDTNIAYRYENPDGSKSFTLIYNTKTDKVSVQR